MHIFVASDDPDVTEKIRSVISRLLLTCGKSDSGPLTHAPQRLHGSQFDVVIAVFPRVDRNERSSVLAEAQRILPQIRAATDAKLLVVGPANNPQLILWTLHEGGADHYIDVADIDRGLEEVITRLQPVAKGKVLSVLSAGGGCGASTVAVNLAARLASRHQRCALFDLNLAFGDLASLLDLKPTRTVTDFARNLNRMDRSLFEELITQHSSGIGLLASPLRLEERSTITAEAIEVAVKNGRQLYPYVVLDLDKSLGEEQHRALRQTNVTLLVFRLEFSSLRRARNLLTFLGRLGIDRSTVRLICNHYGRPKQLKVSQAQEVLGGKVFTYLPDDPRRILHANNEGVPVVLAAPSSKFAKRMEYLAHSLNGACTSD